MDNTTGDVIVGLGHASILPQNSPLSPEFQRLTASSICLFSHAELTKRVCKCSLVERLGLSPSAVLLMIGGKPPAQRAKSAHFIEPLPTPLFIGEPAHSVV